MTGLQARFGQARLKRIPCCARSAGYGAPALRPIVSSGPHDACSLAERLMANPGPSPAPGEPGLPTPGERAPGEPIASTGRRPQRPGPVCQVTRPVPRCIPGVSGRADNPFKSPCRVQAPAIRQASAGRHGSRGLAELRPKARRCRRATALGHGSFGSPCP